MTFVMRSILGRPQLLSSVAAGICGQNRLYWTKRLQPSQFSSASSNSAAYFESRRFVSYKNFGHAKEWVPTLSKLWYLFIGGGAALMVLVDCRGFVKKLLRVPTVEAASIETVNAAPDSGDAAVDTEKPEKKKKKKAGFRERKIIEYENRIRHYSTPDKVFRYFATCQIVHPNVDAEVFMTPDDFLRSISPGMKQPEGLGLDQFRRYDPKVFGAKKMAQKLKEELNLDDESIFLKLGSAGLISFSDYVFLLTVMSTSKRHFEIAFRMYDLNGDGDVDAEEFDQVAQLLRQSTAVGSRHRDHTSTGNSLKGVNSALSAYFFGAKLDGKLTIDKFLEFQQQLQREILTLEFRRQELREDGTLSEADFAQLLLAYASFPPKHKNKIIKRVRKAYAEQSPGISLAAYLDFFHFLNNINDVDTALTFYHIAGACIDQATLKHVASTVAHVQLPDHVVQVVLAIFDENQDGQLSNREFVAIMKDRLMRGLEKPKDTGFIKLIQAALKCANDTKPALLDF